MLHSFTREPELSFGGKLLRINWVLIAVIALMGLIGIMMQFSVADGRFEGRVESHTIRFAVCFVGMCVIAFTDIRLWRVGAYAMYALAFILLIAVEFVGTVGMGAQRWIALGPLQLQPSEFMKIALVIALARYYHDMDRRGSNNAFMSIVPPLILIGLPAALVLKQPDLGTAVLVGLGGVGTMFLAGVPMAFFLLLGCAAGGIVYAVFISRGTSWQMLKDYQYDRIAVFLDPSLDPQGAGYHIRQSKIAFGSGEWSGAGLLNGPQSSLDFLPEKHTDFIMTVIGEEFGYIGAVGMLCVYMLTLLIVLVSAIQVKYRFGRLLAGGVAMTFFAFFAINIAMIMGLVPVVGVPMPFVSYGGTSMLVLHFAFGLVLSAQIHSNVTRDFRS